MIAELENRFENQHNPLLLSIEQALLKAGKGEDYEFEIALLKDPASSMI